MEPISSLVAAPPQTGVQLLFAFLLTLVFQQRFAGITEAQPWTCVVTLLLSVVTAGLLVAPAAVHRVTFQRGLETKPPGDDRHCLDAPVAALVLPSCPRGVLVVDAQRPDDEEVERNDQQ